MQEIKQKLILTDPAAFLTGDMHHCFALFGGSYEPVEGWIDCGDIFIQVQVNKEAMAAVAIQEVEAQIRKIKGTGSAEIKELKKLRYALSAAPVVPRGAL